MAFNNPSIFSFSAYGQPSLDSMTRRTQPELYNIAKAREVIEKIQQAARESENWYPWFRYFGPDMGLAMEKALFNLKVYKNLEEYIVIIDGNILPNFSKKNLNIKKLIKGDTISPSVAVASIYAKVQRDNFMKNLSKLYPKYNWNKNMGYGTKDHRIAIKLYGPTQEHRFSFKPLKVFKL